MRQGIRLIIAAATVLSSGCSSSTPKAPDATLPPAAPVAQRQEGVHVLNDLSELSPANPLDPFNRETPPSMRASAQVAASAAYSADAAAHAESIGTVMHVGTEAYPGEEQFLNRKAARFDRLSKHVLSQLFDAMQELEQQESVARLRLPSDLRPVIVTATLDRDGKLKELVLEQHSGQAAVDKMVLTACKSALYIGNQEPEAMTSDGDYKLKVKARIENYASEDQERWSFKTYLGLAIQ